jgi:hypothetical protein
MPPRRRGGEAKRVKSEAQIAEEQVRCYELKLSGLSYLRISGETGLSVGTVHNRIQARSAQRVDPLAEEHRAIELDRLDRWLEKLDAQIQAGEAVARNVEVAVKVSERRSKLLGMDSADKLEVTTTEVTQADLELAELLREAKARNAAQESALGSG